MSGPEDHRMPAELPGHEHGIVEHYAPPPSGQPPQQAQYQAQQHSSEQFPPPPPGPPPGHSGPPKHASETPLSDYRIPTYDPSHPQFAPPPPAATNDSDLYDQPPPHHHQPVAHGDGTAQQGKSSWTDKLAGWSSKAAVPFNTLANKMGSEAFLPTTLDKECEKAARILKSFCKDGVHSDTIPSTDAKPTSAGEATSAPLGANPQQHHKDSTAAETSAKSKPKSQAILTIPPKVISGAVGLAIFTTARAGFHVSGATGSGVLVARLPDGHWGPPSGVTVHNVGVGFVIGLDIYDCVVVINSREALQAFTRDRVSLGSGLAVTAGPWGVGGNLDVALPGGEKDKGRSRSRERQGNVPPPQPPRPGSSEKASVPNPAPPGQAPTATGRVQADNTAGRVGGAGSSSKERKPSPFREAMRNTKPVYSYVKSRGFYAGVQIDGTVFAERRDANVAFYGAPVSVEQILRGEVPARGPAGQWPSAAKGLFDALMGAEGGRPQSQQQYSQNLAVPGGVSGTGASAGPTGAYQAGSAQGPNRMSGTTAAMEQVSLDGAGGRMTGGAQHAATSSKAQEAAAGGHQAAPPPPPMYSEPAPGDDLPPAYVEDGQTRPGVGDAKTGYH